MDRAGSRRSSTGRPRSDTPDTGGARQKKQANSTNGSVAAITGEPASKRALRSQGRKTMRKLLDAAMVVFARRGYHAARVDDIVKVARTSHGTFYLYFSNKEDLLRALVTEAGTHAQNLADALDRPPELGGAPQWSDVRGWVAAYSDHWIRYAPLFRAWTDLATIDPTLLKILRQTLTLMSDALERQIGLGASQGSLDPHTAGLAAVAMLDRFHTMSEFVERPVDEVALDTLATMIHRSLFEKTV